jgi:hypothetical protein
MHVTFVAGFERQNSIIEHDPRALSLLGWFGEAA